jgi:hypothetical protein
MSEQLSKVMENTVPYFLSFSIVDGDGGRFKGCKKRWEDAHV